MSAARTNWHSGQLPDIAMEDPFEVAVEEVGKPIDLTQPTASLDVRLQELVNREASLDELGVSCKLKVRKDVVCTVCPVSQANDVNSALGALCRVGREQELVCTQLAVSRDAAPASE